MSNSTEKSPSRVAVVADQSDDGSFELRVERPSDPNAAIRPSETAASISDSGSVSNLKSEVASQAPRRKGRAIGIAAGGVAAAGIAGAFALSVGGDQGSPEPPVVEPEPAETFRAFTIQAPTAPSIPRVMLAMDVGADTVAEEEEPSMAQSPQSPPPSAPTAEPEPIPSVNPAAVPVVDDLAQRLQNVRVSAAPVQNIVQLDDDEYDEYDEYDDGEYDDGEYDDEEYD